MPGIVLGLGSVPLERVRAATRQIAHVPWHSMDATRVDSAISLGWVGMRASLDSHVWKPGSESEVIVWKYGHTFKDGSAAGAIGAAHILTEYLQGGVDACCDYDGSFVIVIADARLRRLYLVPDRVCSQPIYYAECGRSLAIAPEVKAVATMLGMPVALSTEGIVGFLTAGYNVGTQTLFKGVQRLEVGKRLEIDLSAQPRLSICRFWKLDFGTARKISRREDAEDALFQAIIDGHRLLLSDQPKFQMLLSGGADSRGMLGACQVLGTMPAKAVSWGLLEDVPRSDAFIARALAARFGVPWDFITTSTDGFVDNCEQWSYVSELSNDNFGWYGEGFGTLRYMHEAGYPCSLIGDESWGCQGFAYDEFHAYARVLTPRVPPSLLVLMHPHLRDRAADAYVENIRDVMRDCDDVDWSDRKDFLYLHARVARFIFGLGYNRGHVTEQRRPFLTRRVLDVVRRLPAERRAYKNLYRTMLKRHLPETMGVPLASVDSLPDWNYDLRAREPLRSCFSSMVSNQVIASGTLGEVLDANAFGALRDAYFAQTPRPVVRQARASAVLKGRIKQMLWPTPAFSHIDRRKNAWFGSGPTQRAIVQPADVLRRVAILVLLERQLPRFTAAVADDDRELTGFDRVTHRAR
jgi:hypothetical protein